MGDGGPATGAQLNNPWSLALFKDELYISDTGNNVIRKCANADGATGVEQTISTVVGMKGYKGFGGDGGPPSSAALNGPKGIAFGIDGALYVADGENHRVRVVVGAAISTFAGTGAASYGGDGGAATSAELNHPVGLAISRDGRRVYISDMDNHRVRAVEGGVITTVAGKSGAPGYDGDGPHAALWYPLGLAVDAEDNLIVADHFNQRLRRLQRDTGALVTIAGTGGTGSSAEGVVARDAALEGPSGLAICGDTQDLYFTDEAASRVRRIAAKEISPSHSPTAAVTTSSTATPSPSSSIVPWVMSLSDASGRLLATPAYMLMMFAQLLILPCAYWCRRSRQRARLGLRRIA